MDIVIFIRGQITQIRQRGRMIILRKLKLALYLPSYILAIPAVLVIRLIKPWLLVRIGSLMSSRIGHFAANTELYLCEQSAGINKPAQRYIDIFYMAYKPICNLQLATMWKRLLYIWPEYFLAPVAKLNHLIPNNELHEVGNNTQHDRDVHNLLDRFPSHLQFTDEEILLGENGLRKMGIPSGIPFVCLIVRDNGYLSEYLNKKDIVYHNYRDSKIQNYVLAAEELVNRGYFVIRMGIHVHETIKSTHKRIIDYATNGMRSDFMDIYLGAKCEFCISTGTGWDEIPEMLRRPMVYVNLVPISYLHTFRAEFLSITKKHVLKESQRVLTLQEIFAYGLDLSLHTSDYELKGVQLVENTPEEIRDIAIEMADRINGSWQPHDDDEKLQKLFWEILPANTVSAYNGKPLHGEIRSRFGANFLRNNRDWLKNNVIFNDIITIN